MTFRRFVDIGLLGFLALVSGGALAQIVSSLPFTLQNNTLADATQVMANLNQIVSNVNANGAKNGVNTDITALSALTTPLTAAQGGSTTYVAGVATGTANAIVVSTPVPTGFALTAGMKVRFIAAGTNTGATTLNFAGSGVKNVARFGTFNLAGAEIQTSNYVEAIYDGTRFQLMNSMNTYPVGASVALRGASLPPGFLYEDGSCVSRTTFDLLFSVIGTTYSVCDGATTYGLPDSRGRIDAGRDNQGGVAANRITNAGSGCTGTTLALGCGAENHVMTAGELVAHTHASPALTDPQHNHSIAIQQSGSQSPIGAGQSPVILGGTSTTVNASTGITIAATTGSSGSSTAAPILNPILIANKAIKY